MKKMKAARLVAPRQVEIVDAEVPDPADGEVRVRVDGCGVCASNVPPFEGREWFEYPMPPGDLGHEAWGVVDAVSSGVEGLREGDPVAMLSYKAYAEYDIAKASNVVALPPKLAGTPFPAEPLACAVNIYRRAGLHRDGKVAIVGVGFLGALLSRLCVDAGCDVVAMTRRPDALKFAADAGAKTTPMDDHWRILNECKCEGGLIGPDGADVVIECVGKQWPLDLAGELVKEHGRLVIAGYHQDGPRSVNMQQWNWKGLDVINAHERRPQTYVDGMKTAVEWVADGRLEVEPLLTHTFDLDHMADALQMTIDRPAGFLKAWIRMR